MADFLSMFGQTPPSQGGMFGQQQQSPLMQMMGGGAGGMAGGGMNPQMMQMLQQLLGAGGPSRLPPGGAMQPPQMGMFGQPGQPHGSVPMTMDQNVLAGIPPQNPGAAGAFGGIPPNILRMLMTPRQI